MSAATWVAVAARRLVALLVVGGSVAVPAVMSTWGPAKQAIHSGVAGA